MSSRYLSIDGWYGRLGNNIQQIGNALMICELAGYNGVKIPQHSCFSFSFIPVLKNVEYSNSPSFVKSSNFFHWKDTPEKTILLPYRYIKHNMMRVLRQYLLPLISQDLSSINDFHGLTIHMRSGDIFAKPYGSSIDSCYIQNPLSYYTNLISQYHACRIVTEPRWETNPILCALAKSYPRLIIQSSTSWNDFLTLMTSEILATSGVGTFAVAAALLNTNLKKLYYSDLYLREHLNPEFIDSRLKFVKTKQIDLPSYIKIGQWYNTEDQRSFMLHYKISDVKFNV